MSTETVTVPAPVEETVVESNTLTAHDRCDLCGAQAYLSVWFGENDLFMCSHHFNEAEVKIREKATKVVDERWKLYTTAKLDVSAA
jgi:hypothetical protein